MAFQKLNRVCCCGSPDTSPADHGPAPAPLPPPAVVDGQEPAETDSVTICLAHGISVRSGSGSSRRTNRIQDDTPGAAPRDPVLSDEEAHLRGRQMIQWIENATANDPPCPVTLNTLTFQQLQDRTRGDLFRMPNANIGGRPGALRFPEGVQSPANYTQRFFGFEEEATYILFFAPGVIGLYDIKRQHGCNAPHPTDVALTAYMHEHGELNSLRYVHVYGVINSQTVGFLQQDFDARSVAEFGEAGKVKHASYMHGTPEYEGLLGVRIPRTVGYLLLGAFPRGTHRIRCIEASLLVGDSFNLRFDIEEI